MSGKFLKRLMSVISAGAISVSMSPIDLIVHAANTETTQTTITGPIIKNETETVKSSDTLTGDANLDGIVNADDSTVLADAITAGATDELKHCDVDFSGVIDQTDADMIASYSTGEITYFPVGKIYNPEAKYITRAEWIHSLAAGFEMSVEDESTIEHYFTDLEDCEYAFEIELAANFGVFDVLGDKFNPDEYVTRDFAAHTMVFCLGIPADVTCSFSDADAVYYDKDAQIALTQGWFAMIDGEFRPSMYVTSGEAELAYADMTTLVELSKIDENHDDVLVVDDSVIEITDTENITLDGDIVTITGSSTVLAEGDIFSVVVDDITIVRKAVTIEKDEEFGVMTVTTEACEEDIIESVEAEGLAYVDYENITPLSDELEVDVVEEEKVVPANYFASPELTPKRASGTVKLKDISLKGSVNVGGAKLTLNGKLSNIKVPYKLETKLLSVKKFYLGFEADASLTANMHASLSKKTTKSVPIISVPVIGCGFLNANVVVSADISLSGDITLSYKCSLGGRIQYENGKWSYTKNFKTKSFTVEAMVDEKIGVRVSINVTLGKKKIGEIYASAGQSGLMKAVDRNNGLSCFDFNAHVYAELGANVDLGFGIGFKKTWQLINKNNSPIWIDLHFENGSRVPSCTYGKTPAKKASGSNGGGKSGGYTKGTGYSTGYASTASGGAAHGTGWTSKYYSSSIEFKELEPPMYITEDTVLTNDLTVDKDLYINANLDLNGHKLTVDGNITIEDGSLIVNKGSATITDNLIENNYSHIYMSNKEDYLCVNGSFELQSYGSWNEMTAGTLELKGDIDGDGSINSTDMHKVILSGTGNQTINLSDDGTMFNMLEIKNSDSRKFIVHKNFIVSNFTEVDGNSLTFVCNESGSDTTDIRLGKISCDTINFNGNVTLRSIDFDGKAINASADVRIYDRDTNLKLNGATMTVKGDFDGQGKIILGGGTLHIDGDFDYYSYEGGIEMNNKNDSLYIGGDFTINGNSWSDFTDGIMEIKGDFYSYNSFISSGNHKLILSGEEDLTVYMSDTSDNINLLEIKNTDKRKVLVDGYFKSNYTDCGENPLNITSRNGYLSLGELTCSELNVTGDVNFYGNTKLMCKKAAFTDDVIMTEGKLDLNGSTTTVTGDLSLTDWQSEFYLNKAILSVGNFVISDGSAKLYMTQGTLNINGDMSVNGHIYMQNEADHIIIKGDWNMTNVYSYSDDITAGTIECVGNITSTGESPFISKGTFKLILNGEKDQTINMEYYPSDSDFYHFANLEVKNADKRAILLKGNLDVGEFTADADTVRITSTGGSLCNAKLRCNLDVTGDLKTKGNVIDLNGKSITVNGNLYQYSGTIQPNTGKLTVNDYCLITDEDSAVYGVSEGVLKMVNDGDYVLVNGDFITKTDRNHEDYLTAGTLEIKGDFYQYDDGTTYAFPASGKHMTILSGDEVQNVTFESYDDSHFNILRMEQAEDKYVFSENPCWNEIASDTTTAATTTGTTTITTTTVTVADTTTETVPTTTNKTTTITDAPTTTASTTTKKLTTTTSTITETTTTTSKTTTTITETTTTNSIETNPVAIIISNTTAAEGENVSIFIDIESNPGVSNAEFDVAFDRECLEFIDAQSGDAIADAEFSCNISEDGTLHISFTGEGKENGTMAVLNFNVLKTPEDSKASVTIVDDSAKITDLNGENVEIEVIYNESTTGNAGDVNNDNEIDLKDVVLIRRFIAGGWDVELDTETADVNNDNEVDLKDVVLIRRYIAGGWNVELA